MDLIRVLVTVHGYEPDGWAREVPRSIAVHAPTELRVLVIEDVPPVAFTSLLPPARHRFQTALAASRRADHEAVLATVTEILMALPVRPKVLNVRTRRSDLGRTIVDHAAHWPAHVIIVGRDARPRLHRTVLGAVHERVVRLASCAVLVTPAPAAPVSLHRLRSVRSAATAEGRA